MNQILATKPTKTGGTGSIKTVMVFFAVSIIIFGICLVTSGSYAMYKSISSNAQNKPSNSVSNTTIETKNEEIQIKLSVDGADIKATVTGETEISFVTYKWDDEEETREDINNVSGEIVIEIPEGQHTLTVTAVDINNNTETKEQQVKGIRKPKLEVVKEENQIVINASDETGIEKIEFIINDKGYLVRVEGATEKEFRYPLPEGDNTIEVKVYNTEGITETFNAQW